MADTDPLKHGCKSGLEIRDNGERKESVMYAYETDVNDVMYEYEKLPVGSLNWLWVVSPFGSAQG